jgi:glycerol-3-phosphate acyltransferase PlsY
MAQSIYIYPVQSLGYIAIAIAAYLLGSVPTGFLVAKAKGVDIRTVGSGNIGATNVFRILGKPAGVFVLVFDGLKGFAACAWLSDVVVRVFAVPSDEEVYLRLIAGLAVVLGHNFTCWLRFKGGKGIATSAGALAALVPWALIIILSIWIILFVLTRYVSLGSVAAAFTLPFATWLTTKNWTLTVVTGVMGALAIYKHRGNIQRLLSGTENRINFKGKGATP